MTAVPRHCVAPPGSHSGRYMVAEAVCVLRWSCQQEGPEDAEMPQSQVPGQPWRCSGPCGDVVVKPVLAEAKDAR